MKENKDGEKCFESELTVVRRVTRPHKKLIGVKNKGLKCFKGFFINN